MGSDTDTIVALATAPGRAGVAVIRASGPEVAGLIQMTTGRDVVPRVAHMRHIRDAAGGVIDEGLILFFEGPASFTGEDVAEFQVHGSRAVTSRLIECLASQPNCRVAEAGEFTLRAFRNGKIDLTQAEGLADLIDAETEVQRKQALDVLQGAFRSQVLTWRQDLLRSVALIEATVDFADEDVPVDVWPEVRSLISGTRASMETALDGADAAQSVREGFEVAVIGRPNVGKSTLLNAIAGREAALVSDVAGTTRDAIEVKVDLDGLPVAFVDLAGIRETDDTVEALGVARARARAAEADLRLHLVGEDEVSPVEIGVGDIVVRGKADLGVATELLSVSGLSGQGIDVLLLQIRSTLEDRVAGRSLIAHQRQRSAISRGVTSLTEIEEAITTGLPEELISESLRSALRELEGVVGYIGVESVLGEIFSRFCIGK